MPVERYFLYRGDITAATVVGNAVAFVTRHAEGHATAVYRLDIERMALSEIALPCGGVAIASELAHLYVAGTDRRVYAIDKAPKPLGQPFADDIRAIHIVSGDRVAVVAGSKLAFLSRNDGSITQTLDLPDDGTCIASDKSGQWLAVGTTKGHVAVFDGQGKTEFEAAESAKMHDGAVTALLFEPEELRFFSAGADRKLLSTFARGQLEPEDKGRTNSHEDIITAMLHHDAERFLTGSKDSTIKNWPRVGGIKPSTLKENIAKVIALLKVPVQTPSLVVVCEDNSLRIFRFIEEGRIDEDCKIKAYGAIDWAKLELTQNYDPKRREKCLKQLADWNDAASLELIAKQIEKDSDSAVKVQAAKLLSTIKNPRAVTLLEPHIGHADGKVRVQVFQGLVSQLGASDFKPIDLALKTQHADIGTLAVKALEPLAQSDDQALARLTTAINAEAWDVRKAALASLETVFDAKSPEASLTALTSKFGDLRALALQRTHERGLLADARVQSAIRRRLEDDDTAVRKVAFLLSVLSRDNLAAYLRANDAELHRQLNEIEKSDKAAPKSPAKSKLDEADYDTLLQATASRALDTCSRGANGLALLGDPRAFALLLQLSREEAPEARVYVCRALAYLGDPRALNRLNSLLYDADASVRDAAFTAVAKLNEKTPLAAAEAGLAANSDDVRRRSLQTLLEAVRTTPPKSEKDSGWNLLVRALNDGSPTVRSEAFKAVLNQQIGGGGEATLRFARGSIHADIRKEVLTEVIAQQAESWATQFLYEFFDDPEPSLRKEAFEAATKKTKEVSPLEAAMKSKFPDTRKLALDGFIKKQTGPAQISVVKALADTDRDVRLMALCSLIDDEAKPSLTIAMTSEYADVRVQAAAALGRLGDPSAVRPLLALATAPEPIEDWKKASWNEAAEAALAALGEIGEPEVVRELVPLLESKNANHRKAAAQAILSSASPSDAPTLRTMMQHADAEVKLRGAFGLAYLGDSSVAPVVMNDFGSLGANAQFAAAVALGGDSSLGQFLDHPTEHLRTWAVLVQLLLELRGTTGTPSRVLACLSAKAARTRLTAAEALEAYADASTFREFVVKLANDRGEETAWKLSVELLDSLADIIAFASPQLKARTAKLFALFQQKEQAAWDKAWAIHAKRFANEIAAAKKQATPLKPKLSLDELRELAFGAYIGLVREQGSATATPAVIRVRQTALSRIFTIATQNKTYARSARPVLAQALGDPNQPVRLQAYEHLLALNFDKNAIAADALEAGHTDLGVKGLELLTDGTSSKDGSEVLERVLLSRTDDLAIEAAKLLAKTKGQVSVAAIALDAVYEKLRSLAVQWLAAEFDKNADAQKSLRKAVQSRYRHVRQAAAIELATKKDPAAFDTLAAMLKEATEENAQRKLIESFTTLGDARAAKVMLDRIENDPTGTAVITPLFQAVGSFRQIDSTDRLLKMMDNEKWNTLALDAGKHVSGFDQQVYETYLEEDDIEYRKYEKEQYPRHPEILAKFMEKAATKFWGPLVNLYIPLAMQSRGNAVDPVLVTLSTNVEPDVRVAALTAIGWRLKRRNSSPDALLKALRHKDPMTQFIAAEGLARSGRPEGLQILLSSLEYLENVQLRHQAVLALGELSDPRAVDVLLKLASEDGHALQESAAEAIGHMRKSPRAEEIGKLLERLAKSPMEGVAQRALVGLRWFDSPSGWVLIRNSAKSNSWRTRMIASEQLGYATDAASRDVLLERIRTDSDNDVFNAAFDAAVKSFGPESLEPHYAVFESSDDHTVTSVGKSGTDVLKIITERGDTLQILQTLAKSTGEGFTHLETILMSRSLPSDDVMTKALAGDNAYTVKAAARMLGRTEKISAKVKSAIETALAKWWADWQPKRENMLRRAGQPDEDTANKAVAVCEVALEELLWPASRFNIAEKTLIEVLTARPHDDWMFSLRKQILTSLTNATPGLLTAIESVMKGMHPELRRLSAGLLAKFDAKQAVKLAPDFFSDRGLYARLATSGKSADTAKANVSTPHYQPLALPSLITSKDVSTLAKVAKDKKAAEPVRLGAVEGLGFMAAEDAEKVLAEIGGADGDDEDVRKAAWKALRRSKRARKQAFTAEGT